MKRKQSLKQRQRITRNKAAKLNTITDTSNVKVRTSSAFNEGISQKDFAKRSTRIVKDTSKKRFKPKLLNEWSKPKFGSIKKEIKYNVYSKT